MKKLLAVMAATTCISASHAQEVKEFNIGILGGENAQDRMTSNECYRAAIEKDMVFTQQGGFNRANKLFEGQLQRILETFNHTVWKPAA